jgi:hypothetical protein
MTSPGSGVKSYPRAKVALRRALIAKGRLRRRLAALPIEEKVRMVAHLQRVANEIRRATGREELPEWPLD